MISRHQPTSPQVKKFLIIAKVFPVKRFLFIKNMDKKCGDPAGRGIIAKKTVLVYARSRVLRRHNQRRTD